MFYDYDFLRAYERVPLQPTEEFHYIVFGRPASAVLPAYVQSTDDAIGTISGLGLPDRRPGDRILLTHVAHCYDTAFPAFRDQSPVREACAVLADIARRKRLKWFAFLNVPGSTPLAAELAVAGLAKIPMNTRFRTDVGSFSGVNDFVAGIPSKKGRFALRRSLRQAQRIGLVISHPAPAEAIEAVTLCRLTTARHGTADYYPERFGEFVALAASMIRVTEVRVAGRLASAAICLHDRTRFHLWAGGLDHEATAEIHSSFPLMLHCAAADAIGLGRPILETGRGNAPTKSRFRLTPVPLFAFVGQP